jgi:Zn-dependent protease
MMSLSMSSVHAWLFRQPPDPPPYVVENTARTPPRRLATVFGIDWMATSMAWIAPLWMAVAGVVVASLMEAGANGVHRLVFGILYAALILVSIVLHQLGGAAAGALAGSPMRKVVFTATLAYNQYDRSRDYPGRVHLIRSLAEPVTNLLLGACMLALYRAGYDARPVLFLAILNLFFFVVAMAPLPTMHGGVVLRHAGKRRGADH